MIRLSQNDDIPVEEYGEELNRLGYILYDREEAKYSLNFMKSRASTLGNRAVYVMKLNSACRYFSLDKDSVYSYLIKVENCASSFFYTGKTQSASLDTKRVLEKLYNRGKAHEFLELYMEHKSKKKKSETLNSIITKCAVEAVKDRDQKMLYKMPFTAREQVNRRFNYKDVDIISQIPKEVCGSIGVEDGYFLAWGDFAQSDFRIAYNLFIRSPENDKIMNQYSDKYEALARIVNKTLGRKFDLEEFKSQRSVYKKLTLATMYGTRSSVVPAEQDFISTFSAFLGKCPKYAEFQRRLRGHLEMKSSIRLMSYFGHEEFIRYNAMNTDSTVYEALNSPVQSGTSEVVILTVMSILDLAEKCGLTRDQFSVYFVRHDEPIFRIREDAKDFLWILKQHSTVLVDNWAPLEMDFGFGYRYKVEDDGLMRDAEECYSRNADKIDSYEVSADGENDYYPLKELLRLTVHWIILKDVTIVTFYQPSTGKAMFSLFETTDEEEIIKNVRIKIKDAAPKIAESYQDVLVLNNFYQGDDFYGDTHTVYQYEKSQVLEKTVQLCRGMVAMYCRKYGLELPEYCKTMLIEYPALLDVLVTG